MKTKISNCQVLDHGIALSRPTPVICGAVVGEALWPEDGDADLGWNRPGVKSSLAPYLLYDHGKVTQPLYASGSLLVN